MQKALAEIKCVHTEWSCSHPGRGHLLPHVPKSQSAFSLQACRQHQELCSRAGAVLSGSGTFKCIEGVSIVQAFAGVALGEFCRCHGTSSVLQL